MWRERFGTCGFKEQRDTGNQGKKKYGVELLSHTQLCSIIAAGPLNNRVRDGNVCFKTAINTGIKISKVVGIKENFKQNLEEITSLLEK